MISGCDEDFTAVWVTFENSLDRTQGSIDSQIVGSKEECQDLCNQMVLFFNTTNRKLRIVDHSHSSIRNLRARLTQSLMEFV